MKHHLSLRNFRQNINKRSERSLAAKRTQKSNEIERDRSSKVWNEQELQARNLIEQYVFAKLSIYARKSLLWKLVHALKIKRRILAESKRLSAMHSLSNDLIRESIHQVFNNIDQLVIQCQKLMHFMTGESTFLFEKVKKANNQWRALQIARAKQIFEYLNNDEYKDIEILRIYYAHIFETLTPKRDASNSNCDAQLRTRKLNLTRTYERAECEGRDYLSQLLQRYRERSTPDLELIREMVQLGLQNMKTMPKIEDFENARTFLSRIDILHNIQKAYETDLNNMGDDFMLLRFCRVFGANELNTTARLNTQYVYLVHLFIKSVLHLLMMMQTRSDDTEDIYSTVNNALGTIFKTDRYGSVVEIKSSELFSPELSVDQWTWLLEKWRDALRTFPIMLTRAGSFSRLVRTTIGIGMARLFSIAEKMINSDQSLNLTLISEQLFHALQTGFYFGFGYVIVDCVQDEIHNLDKIFLHYLAPLDKNQYTNNESTSTSIEIFDKWLLVMEDALVGGEFNRKDIPKTPMTPLLLETFDSLITLMKQIEAMPYAFNELALLLRAQKMDRKHQGIFYNDEDLFLGAMMKCHFTYTCTTYMGDTKSAREKSDRLWTMPLLGQLTDDCRDFYDDVQLNTITAFTHYSSFAGRQQSSDKHMLNPFYTLLYLCSDIYLSSNRNAQTGAFVGRRIARTLKSIQINSGESALREFLYLFCNNNVPLHDYFWTNVRDSFCNISDPEKYFFRALNNASVHYARTNRKLEVYAGDHLKDIEDALQIHAFSRTRQIASTVDPNEQLLLAGMNYSVKAGGKRLRPLLMMMVSDLFNLNLKNVLPLACGIEYLHTSSLIFDDLPAQDNSDLRRGRPTLHKTSIDNDIPEKLCEGRAQLAAVDLIAVSMNLINHDLVKNGFPPERVNHVVSEISLSMHDLCVGQMMDLHAAHINRSEQNHTVENLDRTAWLKTGKALEIVLITPAILSMSSSEKIESLSNEIENLRELARLMGILFQMRDDLLDLEGENIGKPAALDLKNNTVTYVSILGIEGAKQRLQSIRQQTLELVAKCWPSRTGTLTDVINYIVDRKH